MLPDLRTVGQSCRIFAYGLRDRTVTEHVVQKRGKARAVTDPPLPQQYASVDAWAMDQYSVELWLQRALLTHPFRVTSPAAASVIMIAANLSMLCLSNHEGLAKDWWFRLLGDERLWPSASSNESVPPPPKVIMNLYHRCPPPWKVRPPPSDLIVLQDYLLSGAPFSARLRAYVSPFVVAKPAWLVAASNPGPPDPALRPPPDNRSRLLFFAGHVPKIYVRPTRYRIWRGLQRFRELVTIASADLSCMVGGYASACALGMEALQSASHDFFDTFCRPYCNRSWMIATDPKTGQYKPPHCDHMPVNATPAARAAQVLRKCAMHALGDAEWWRALPAMVADTRVLSHDAYLAHTMTHRYCLVVPGDYPSTHKVTETVAIGGAGGCIPVFVVPTMASRHRPSDERFEDGVASLLPYTSWLDYCSIAFLVTEWQASRDVGAVVERLAAIPEDVLNAKRASLRAVRPAFVFRRNSTLDEPSAAEYILHEACHAAGTLRGTSEAKRGGRLPKQWPIAGGGRYGRCRLD